MQRYGLTASINIANWGRAHGYDWLFHGVRSVFTYLRCFNLSWAQELCIYMFIWMAKFGAAYGVRTGIHVGVDVLINRLSDTRASASSCSACSAARCSPTIGTMGAKFVYELCVHRSDLARSRNAELDRLSASRSAPI